MWATDACLTDCPYPPLQVQVAISRCIFARATSATSDLFITDFKPLYVEKSPR